MFKHALTHDVAYSSLLVQRRKELHGVIGAAIEELYADRLAEQYEMLAHHFSKAEDGPRALDYLVKAAEKAAQGFANQGALALYQQALDAAGHLGEAAPRPSVDRDPPGPRRHLHGDERLGPRTMQGEQVLELARRVEDQATTRDRPRRDGAGVVPRTRLRSRPRPGSRDDHRGHEGERRLCSCACPSRNQVGPHGPRTIGGG